MPTIHLIEGPVGAGKSTYAQALSRLMAAPHIALDTWFTALFSDDRPPEGVMAWYAAHKERLLRVIWSHSQELMSTGGDVILELGLIQAAPRTEFCRRVLLGGYGLRVHVLDAPLEVRRARVQRRNVEKGPTYAMGVPEHIFELASSLWQPPDEIECAEYSVTFVDSTPNPIA